MEHKLFAGYARQVVEPTESIPLGGYSNELKRFHTAMTEDICQLGDILFYSVKDSGKQMSKIVRKHLIR